jgi:hypothetical protein
MSEAKPKSAQLWNQVGGYVKRFLFWLAIIMAVTGIIDFLIGWRTLFLYAESLFLVGGLAIAVGALGTMGNWSQRRSFPYQYASSVSDADSATRAQREVKDTEASYSFSVLAILSGFSLVLLSILIHQIT